MSRLTIVERTKLNLTEATVVVGGGSSLEADVIVQTFAGFGARQVRRTETPADMRGIINAEPVDLLLLNAVDDLPEWVVVVREMRRLSGQTRYAPIVLTRANVTPAVMREARDGAINYVVAKPLVPRTLFQRLLWIVDDARPFIDSANDVGPDRRVRRMGPPAGMAGRREGDLPPEVGSASTPNLAQEDIDAMMNAFKKAM